ncbi:MAG TPA: hypothetical protein VLC92_15940 [Rhodocyclaceae bacterium]|nr:hypothetical protein [Rhodocyclaceae bacterium]
MRSIVPRYLPSLTVGIVVASFAMPALATRQCPPEYGEKSALVVIAGWAVLAAGFVAGLALLRYAFLRARNRTRVFQFFILLAGMAGTVFIWFIGLVVALKWFFLTC